MSSLKQHLLVKSIFLLSKLGAHRASLAYTDKLLRSEASLSQLRKAVDSAYANGDHDAALKISEYAIQNYPSNSFGYTEKAKIQAEQGAVDAAIQTLNLAPSCAPVNDALSKLRFGEAPPKKAAMPKAKPKAKAKPKVKPKAALPAGPSALEVSLLKAGSDISVLELIAQQARQAIIDNPDNATNYGVLTRVHSQLKEHDKLIAAINSFPTEIASRLHYRLMLARAYQLSRDQESAYEVLLKAQVDHPSERKLLMRISDMLKDDAKVARAYSYLCASQALYPTYGTVKRLSFEIDNFLFDAARSTLDSILAFPREVVMKFMPMINRATPFFPEMREQIQAARGDARQLLAAEKGRKGINPDDQLKVAIKCRWLHEAQQIINRNKGGAQPVSEENQLWLDTVVRNLGPARALVEIASSNESSASFHGLYQGSIININSRSVDVSKVVEVFIPTVFFAAPGEEKPSYATVREFLMNVFKYLLSRKDLVLVPRHQWNWRNCDPSIPGSRVVSYHTNAPYNVNHLHIQEVPLAGRCSIDHQGFAGYSSLAAEHEQIRVASRAVSSDVLEHNEQHLHDTYVTNNVSKYSQTQDRVRFEDDYVFVALQIPTDTVAALAEISGVDLVSTVAEHFAGTNTKVRVKRHPYCNSMSVQRTLKDLSKRGIIELSDASVHDLISGAKSVFTVNSEVGLEALLHGRPVVITGEADYAYAVAAHPRTVEELKACLQEELTFDKGQTQELLHYYVNSYSMAANDASAIHRKLEAWLR